MAMMHAYGNCEKCRQEGALWRVVVMRRSWLRPWKRVQVTEYWCDECNSKHNSGAAFADIQQPLGEPFSTILHKNLWDLYESGENKTPNV